MRVLIVDDEANARLRLRRHLESLQDVEIVGEAATGREALELIAAVPVDVALLDIRMPVMDGLETAFHLAAEEHPPAVIFTTAYEEFAVEAFEARAVAYLLKPIRRERLEAALMHAARPNRAQLTALGHNHRARAHICARVRDELKIVPIEEVFYFKADQKYVSVRHPGGELLIDEPLKALEDEFDPRFVRIHRNALVALEHIDALEKDSEGHFFIRLRGVEERLEVSRRLVAEVRRVLRQR